MRGAAAVAGAGCLGCDNAPPPPHSSQNRAFQVAPAAVESWADALPARGVDVLITHVPPRGARDCGGGSAALARAVAGMAPAVHVFGHMHHGHGAAGAGGRTLFVNACSCDGSYRASHAPLVFDLPAGPARGAEGSGGGATAGVSAPRGTAVGAFL